MKKCFSFYIGFKKMLKGMVGIVTGGASGLGKATVERFVREGAKVTLIDLPTSRGADVASALGAENCLFAPSDITKESDIMNALNNTKEKFGKLDITVNCAGIGVAFKTYNFNKNRFVICSFPAKALRPVL